MIFAASAAPKRTFPDGHGWEGFRSDSARFPVTTSSSRGAPETATARPTSTNVL